MFFSIMKGLLFGAVFFHTGCDALGETVVSGHKSVRNLPLGDQSLALCLGSVPQPPSWPWMTWVGFASLTSSLGSCNWYLHLIALPRQALNLFFPSILHLQYAWYLLFQSLTFGFVLAIYLVNFASPDSTCRFKNDDNSYNKWINNCRSSRVAPVFAKVLINGL